MFRAKDQSLTLVLCETPDPSNGLGCSTCKSIVSQIEDTCVPYWDLEQFTDFLESLCVDLPGSVSPICEYIVDVFAPVLFQLLQDGEQPENLCTLIGMCSSLEPIEIEPPIKDSTCSTCETIVKYAEEIFLPDMTYDEFMEFFDGFCECLPKFITTQCLNIVDEYAPSLYQWLQQEEDPETFCTLMGLCDGTFEEPEDNSDFTCTICQYIVDFAEDIFLPDMSLDEFLSYFETFCSDYLPRWLVAECDSIVD
ncbi:Saposin like protein, partial [Aduncisulcus paluster]